MTLERELQIATGLAYRAGAALRRHQTELTHVRYKAHGELVMAADVEADAIIRGGLEAAFPADAVFSEETPDSPIRLTRRRVWIVDPLDSTSNFTERGDEYSVSIGLAVDGRAALGIVHNPAREEMFAGYEPAGMTLNGAPVRVRETSDLAHARVTVFSRGSARMPSTRPMRSGFPD